MADNKCVRCHEGDYAEIDREEDVPGRVFLLFECGNCQSLVIRKDGWDPASWANTPAE
jgi:hypothetical protein